MDSVSSSENEIPRETVLQENLLSQIFFTPPATIDCGKMAKTIVDKANFLGENGPLKQDVLNMIANDGADATAACLAQDLPGPWLHTLALACTSRAHHDGKKPTNSEEALFNALCDLADSNYSAAEAYQFFDAQMKKHYTEAFAAARGPFASQVPEDYLNVRRCTVVQRDCF